MNLTHIGSDYGGWWVDLDRIPPDSCVIDAGVRLDTTFVEGLISAIPGLRVICINPGRDSQRYAAERGLPFILGAIGPHDQPTVTIYRNLFGSESCLRSHRCVSDETYKSPRVSLRELIAEHRPALVKLDIEGMEYNVYRDCIDGRVPQVCIEFHHRMVREFSAADTERAIGEFVAAGYEVLKRTEHDEVTFGLVWVG